MSVRSHKTAARAILLRRDRARLEQWGGSVPNPFRTLTSLTFDQDELVRWRAIEAAGWLAAVFAETDVDRLRDTIRRLLWLMNDESGGVAWHAPELIGEILRHAGVLVPDFAHLLPSFLCEEPFEAGTHVALTRIAPVAPEVVRDCADRLERSLHDEDPVIRALAAQLLGMIEGMKTRSEFSFLREDSTEIRLYDFNQGELIQTTVGHFVNELLF